MSTVAESKPLSPPSSFDVNQRLEVVGQIAAGLAHEINTPVQYVGDNVRYVSTEIEKILGLLRGYRKLGDLIQGDKTLKARYEDLKTTEQREDVEFLFDDIPSALEQTISGIETIAGIVGSLKALVHPGGREVVETDVNEAIDQAVTLSRGEWKKSAKLDLNLEPELPKVSCYSGELNQVLINLIVNAAHAVAEANKAGLGRICITSFRYKTSIGIMIEDSGSGIPLEIQHRVFDPFFTSKDVGKGTGQGLAFAHASIVERSGGTLFFETAEDQGTTFHIYLPIAEDEFSESESNE